MPTSIEDEADAAPAGAAAATAKKGSTRTARPPDPPGLASATPSGRRSGRSTCAATSGRCRCSSATGVPVPGGAVGPVGRADSRSSALNALTSAFYQYFSFTAPLGTAFIAGFFAPRASWLVGGLAALASVGFQAIAFARARSAGPRRLLGPGDRRNAGA